MNDPDDLLHREPLVAMFRVRGPPPQQAFTFVLVNIHTDPHEADTEVDSLAQVYQVVRRSSAGEDDIILLGDLNVDEKHLGQLGRIDGVRPVVRNMFTNTRQDATYDNFLLHQPSTAEFTGRWGVFNYQQLFKLTPDQALQVSDHLPIWAEFNAYESATPGRVATRDAATIRAQSARPRPLRALIGYSATNRLDCGRKFFWFDPSRRSHAWGRHPSCSHLSTRTHLSSHLGCLH